MMPKIINAYSDANNSIADSLKSIGQSIWGDEAKNEGLRQNAEKVRRENAGRQGASEAFRRGDVNELGAQGILGGMSGGDVGAYGLYGQANRYGAKDPRTTNSWVGAGHPYAGSYPGFEENEANKRAMEQDRTDAAKYTPIITEDPTTGYKRPAGAMNTRTGVYQPFDGTQPQGGFNTPQAPQSPQGPAVRAAPMNVATAPLADENAPVDPQLLTGNEAAQYWMKTNPALARRAVQVLQGAERPPPTGVRTNAVGNQIMNIASQIEPGFNQTRWAERFNTAKDFASSGTSGKRVTGLEQAILHTENMARAADALGNKNDTDLPGYVPGVATGLYNKAHIAIERARQHPEPNNFDTMAGPWTDEMAGLFKRTGAMTDAEIAHWRAVMQSTNSPAEHRGAVKTAMEALQHSLETLEDTRTRGLGSFGMEKLPPLLNERTQGTLNRVNEWATGNGRMGPAQAAPAGPQPATALPPGPTGHPPSFNDRFEAAQPGAPAAAAPQAPAAAPAAARRARNAQGQIIEWNGQAWVPTQ